jgi:hypothetical protein
MRQGEDAVLSEILSLRCVKHPTDNHNVMLPHLHHQLHKALNTESHRETCPEEEVRCGICKERMPRRLLEKHRTDGTTQAKHLDLLASQVVELRAENAALKKREVRRASQVR